MRVIDVRRSGHHAPAGGQGLQLPERGRPADRRPGRARPHQGAGRPARLDRRVDLPGPPRPHPGHRHRRQGPPPVPLPRRVAGAAGPGEARPHAGDGPGPAPAAERLAARPGRRRHGPRPGAGRAPCGCSSWACSGWGARPTSRTTAATAWPPCARATCVRSAASCASTTRPRAASGGSSTIGDPEVADVVRALKRRRGGGPELLAYKDDRGRWVDVRSSDINEYLQEALGPDFSAKDFRTWAATVLAAVALAAEEAAATSEPARRSGTGRWCGWCAGGRRAARQHARPWPGAPTSTPGSSSSSSRARRWARTWRRVDVLDDDTAALDGVDPGAAGRDRGRGGGAHRAGRRTAKGLSPGPAGPRHRCADRVPRIPRVETAGRTVGAHRPRR